jgi:phosphoribosylglycinamide formyltransferase-1
MTARVVVLLSGHGTVFQSLLDATLPHVPLVERVPATIVGVLSSRADAYGVVRAEKAGIPTSVLNPRNFLSREAYDVALDAWLGAHAPHYVCLAGFMRILTPGLVAKWEGRILNTHPSLLPLFKGAHAVRDALAQGVSVTGCTVHYVAEGVDEGPVIAQSAVPVRAGDTEDSLRERVAERRLYPYVLRGVLQSAGYSRA